MPTYDYRCDACGHTFEHFQSMTSKHLRKCPKCEKRKLKRLIGSGAGVIFKGSGFYQTDYKKSGGSGASKKKDEGASSSKPESTTKSETKKSTDKKAKSDD